MKTCPTIAVGAVCAVVWGAAARADTIHVPFDHATIQAAIAAAHDGDEILVAPGSYPQIIDLAGKAVVLRSLAGPDATVIDATGVPDPGAGRPVVRIDSGEGSDTVIDGFTITGGTGDTAFVGTTIPIGGGVFISQSAATLRNCIIRGNTSFYGAGVFVDHGGVTLEACTIESNAVPAGGEGAGMYLYAIFDLTLAGSTVRDHAAGVGAGVRLDGFAATVRVTDSTFEHNDALNGGGAVHADGSMLECRFERSHFRANTGLSGGAMLLAEGALVRDCSFIDNAAHDLFEDGGGAIRSGGSSVFAGCAFSGNTAAHAGGAVLAADDDFLVHCSFAGNQAASGDALTSSAPAGAPVTVLNSVIWGPTQGAAAEAEHDGGLVITRSIVRGGWPGDANLDADPLFVDPAGHDLALLPGSPAIDAGDALAAAPHLGPADLAGNPRLADDPATPNTGPIAFGGVIDRGAYEFAPTPAGPLIAAQPESVFGQIGGQAFLTVTAPAATSFQWFRNDQPVADGPGFTGATGPVLTVHLLDASAEALYSVAVGDGVRTETSIHAGIVVLPPDCLVDLNHDGLLDFFDVLDFLARFSAGCP